jgi:hypothetical protein
VLYDVRDLSIWLYTPEVDFEKSLPFFVRTVCKAFLNDELSFEKPCYRMDYQPVGRASKRLATHAPQQQKIDQAYWKSFKVH